MSPIPVKLIHRIAAVQHEQNQGTRVRAMALAGVGFLFGLLAQIYVMHAAGEGALTGVQMLWLGLLPIQIGAFGAASLSLLADSRAGDGLAAFGLLQPPRAVLGEVARMLLWVCPLVQLLAVLMSALWSLLELPPSPNPLITSLYTDGSAAMWVSFALVLLVVAPLTEEVLFRYVLHDAMAAAALPQPAVWTSVVFALVHLQPENLPGLFVLALALQRLRRRTGGLWGPILLHVGFNGISALLIVGQMLARGQA